MGCATSHVNYGYSSQGTSFKYVEFQERGWITSSAQGTWIVYSYYFDAWGGDPPNCQYFYHLYELSPIGIPTSDVIQHPTYGPIKANIPKVYIEDMGTSCVV